MMGHADVTGAGRGEQHVARQVVVVIQEHMRFDPALVRRNWAQGNSAKQREMVVESRESSGFLKRKVRLRTPMGCCVRKRSRPCRTTPGKGRRGGVRWRRTRSTSWEPWRYPDAPACRDSNSNRCRFRARNRYGPAGRITWPRIGSSNRTLWRHARLGAS